MKPKYNSPTASLPFSPELIKRRIFVFREQQVMLDNDLAELYQVPTKALNQAVRRNKNRFPEDFMFKLSHMEIILLNRSQIVTAPEPPFMASKNKAMGSQFATASKRNIRFTPYAFTEHGIAML